MSKELEEHDVSRQEAAEQLREIAGELHTGDSMDLDINNRTIHLSPAETIALEVTVEETSAFLGGDREAVTVTLDWDTS